MMATQKEMDEALERLNALLIKTEMMAVLIRLRNK